MLGKSLSKQIHVKYDSSFKLLDYFILHMIYASGWHLQDCTMGNCAVFSCNISRLRANESSTVTVTGFIDDASFVVCNIFSVANVSTHT